MPPSEAVFQKFHAIVRRVLESPRSNFYRDKYHQAGFSFPNELRVSADIIHVPRLAKAEVAAVPPDQRLYTEPGAVKVVRLTSGTTGGQPLVVFRSQPHEPHIVGTRPLVFGLSADLSILCGYYPRSDPPPHFPVITLGAAIPLASAVSIIQLCAVDALIGSPTRLVELGDTIPLGERNRIRGLYVGGEMITREQIVALHRLFPAADVGLRYAQCEVGPIGYQCDVLKRTLSTAYHSYPQSLLELTDPETGRWVSASDEIGEIVVSELVETPHQFIRYRTGDAGRIVNREPCACSAPFTFEITGRLADDVVKIAGGVIRADEIARVLSELGQWFEPDFRAVVDPIGADSAKPVFVLNLIPKDLSVRHPVHLRTTRDELARRIFVTPTQTLADFLREGRIGRFELVLVDVLPHDETAQRVRLAHP